MIQDSRLLYYHIFKKFIYIPILLNIKWKENGYN